MPPISTKAAYTILSKLKAPVTISTTEPVTLKGKLSGAVECTVEGVILTISGVTVQNNQGCALMFIGAGNTLTLEGKNLFKSDWGNPGIRVEEGTELTIRGEGSLRATGGGNAAGIGGGDCGTGGMITIESGDITAIGGDNGAGIGGGSCRGGGTVIITGGTVTATGGNYGAGIGGAGDNSCGTVLITNGTVVASGGKAGGAGIGDGWNSSSRVIQGGEITITGGTVTATGYWGNAGIGGGFFSSGGVITIEGGTIIAIGGIGGGLETMDDEGRITISGGTITAIGGTAGIGGRADILISGGDITATGGSLVAGIEVFCVGDGSETKTLTITGGTIVATGGDGAPGIGCGPWRRFSKIYISGGDITAIGGGPYKDDQGKDAYDGGAGIGTAHRSSLGDIVITGGTIRAYGGPKAAGIGTGRDGESGNILITGGTVIAIGGIEAAGIGGGKNADSLNTTITMNGLVYAQRGDGDTYDIGAGDGGKNVTGSLVIKEKAAVFLGTNQCVPPAAKGHSKKRPENKTDPMVLQNLNGEPRIYGIEGTGNSPWAEAQAGYFVLCGVQYDGNGGEGEAPEAVGPVHITTVVTAASAEGLIKEGYTFTCWNTKANLRGTTYFPGDEITFLQSETELTLYAQWDKVDP